MQLEITPLGARALFGMPPAEIAALTLPLDAVLGRLAAELVDRLHSASTWCRQVLVSWADGCNAGIVDRVPTAFYARR